MTILLISSKCLFLGQVQKPKGPPIGAGGVELIVQNLKDLTHLNLSRNPNIDDATIITALIGDKHVDLQFSSPSLPNLIDLTLGSCSINAPPVFVEIPNTCKMMTVKIKVVIQLFGEIR